MYILARFRWYQYDSVEYKRIQHHYFDIVCVCVQLFGEYVHLDIVNYMEPKLYTDARKQTRFDGWGTGLLQCSSAIWEFPRLVDFLFAQSTWINPVW